MDTSRERTGGNRATPRQRTSPPLPSGWFAVAFSSEIRPGDVQTRRFFGGDVVLHRTLSGRAVVSPPYCPHLGAHFGHGARVVGETLRCRFHGFRFDAEGACVSGYPGKRVPPSCAVEPLHSRETNGQILAWFAHDHSPPTWEVPALEGDGYRALLTKTFSLAGHPQETTENSVDIGHFVAVHEYEDVSVLEPMRGNGPLFTGHYAMRRRRGGLSKSVTTDFRIRAFGLGYSVVDVNVQEHGLVARTFVLATPSDEGRVDLRIALQLQRIASKRAVHPLAVLAPRAVLEWVVERAAMSAYAADVRQDFELWNHKTYVEHPALADGDGPIGLYRRWVRQFYPAPSAGPAMKRRLEVAAS